MQNVGSCWAEGGSGSKAPHRGKRVSAVGRGIHRLPMRMVTRWALLALTWIAVGCAGPAGRGMGPVNRPVVIDRIVSTSVKIVVERVGERVASGSGVVVASSGPGEEPATLVLTAAHLFQGKPDATVYVRFAKGADDRPNRPARIVRRGDVDALDLALLRVSGVALTPVTLADSTNVRLGEGVLIVGFPWGKRLAVFSGIVSQVPAEITSDAGSEDGVGPSVMVDASVGNGVSGGGVYQEATGELLGVVEGYRTASVALKDRTQTFSLKVPMPGETFVISVDQIRGFLQGLVGPPDAR